MALDDERLHGLYVITDAALCADRGMDSCVRDALRGGARLVQYRDKSADHARREREAHTLRELCEIHKATFIVNDDIALARAVGADGVHLGRDDAGIAAARAQLGEQAIIGVSCYDNYEHAVAAAKAGASYVAFGSMFPSAIKPDAVRAPLQLLERAYRELGLPVCAIGGIDRDNIHQVVTAGATMAAVISAVFAMDNIAEATAGLAHAFDVTD